MNHSQSLDQPLHTRARGRLRRPKLSISRGREKAERQLCGVRSGACGASNFPGPHKSPLSKPNAASWRPTRNIDPRLLCHMFLAIMHVIFNLPRHGLGKSLRVIPKFSAGLGDLLHTVPGAGSHIDPWLPWLLSLPQQLNRLRRWGISILACQSDGGGEG